MKNISEFINENIEAAKVEDLGFSKEELLKDYEDSNYIEGQEKKDMISKYHVSSKKMADIKNAILVQARIERTKRNKDFDVDDKRMFFRLSNLGERYASCVPWFNEETSEFLLFLKDEFWKDIEKHKLQKKVYWSRSEWKYGTSYSDITTMNRYLNIEQYINDNNPENIKSKADKESVIKLIVSKLSEQMADFKKLYMEKIKKYAEDEYDSAPKIVEKMKAKSEELSKKMDELYKQDRRNYGSWEYKDLEKSRDKARRTYYAYKDILSRYTKNEYVDKTLEDAERKYNSDVETLAEKINNKELKVGELKVNNVAEDPKFFEMLITDGEKNLYARSVWAAEYSDKMIPHFRFIITNRRGGKE